MSRMFELLQQAQRDHELLKQSVPLSANHSRNLDVLHRAGMDEQLFSVTSAPEALQAEPAPPASGFSRGETYKLVQHLFADTDPVSPRAVVFCGVDQVKGRDWICAQTAELLATLKQGS